MSNTHRQWLLWISLVALLTSLFLAARSSAPLRGQLTWQGSYVTAPREIGEPRIMQGHGAAPVVFPISDNSRIGWQLLFGVSLILLGFLLHAFLLSSSERPVRVRIAPPKSGRPQETSVHRIVAYWCELRL